MLADAQGERWDQVSITLQNLKVLMRQYGKLLEQEQRESVEEGVQVVERHLKEAANGAINQCREPSGAQGGKFCEGLRHLGKTQRRTLVSKLRGRRGEGVRVWDQGAV